MARLAERVSAFGTTVFSEFSALAQAHGAVNLGQGFPDFDGPEEVKAAAARAIHEGVNQYAIGSGAESLRRAIAEHSKRFYGQEVDPAPAYFVGVSDTPVVKVYDPGRLEAKLDAGADFVITPTGCRNSAQTSRQRRVSL